MIRMLTPILCILLSMGVAFGTVPNDDTNRLSPKKNTSPEFRSTAEVLLDGTQFFVSSNTDNRIGIFTVMDDNSITMGEFMNSTTDADGIYYDRANDVLYQLNRVNNRIDVYGDVCTNPTLIASSTSNFSNGREIAVSGNKLVVVQDAAPANNNRNRLIVYTITPNSITFDRAYNSNLNLWGIHLDGATLYAVVDNSNRIAIFNDFFSETNSFVTADAGVRIQNLVRTHGITYDSERDMMLLTDIGDAANDRDGALVLIRNFTQAAADGFVSTGEQTRVSGGASQLGNPVDVAMDADRQRVFVAERARDGGKVLVFKMPVLSGGIAPTYSMDFPGASAVYFSDVDDIKDPCALSVDGGLVSLPDGNTTATIKVDGMPDVLSFLSTSAPALSGASFTYVVTDADGMILAIPTGNTVDFDPAGTGVCLVYGLSYTGALNIAAGDNLPADGLAISDDCFELSTNRITVNRVPDQEVLADFFVSSNTQAVIGNFSILADGSVTCDTFPSVANDADGIYYDQEEDVLYQLNRTDNVINAYSNVSTSPTLTATSTSDFSNGREIAVSGDKLIVAQDANDANGQKNRLVVYTISPTSITLHRSYDVAINLWGLHANFQTLYAVVDNSGDVAVFNNFFVNQSGPLSPNAIISVEGLVRTHGITYDAAEDLMLLTDVGDAASSTDGALVVIKQFTTAASDNLISMNEQIRVKGGGSRLGNPVDLAYDKQNQRIYVAERANGGGRVLGFKFPSVSSSISPVFNKLFPGASAIHLSTQRQIEERCEIVDGGVVAIEGGGTQTTIIIDGDDDLLTFASTVDPEAEDFSFTFVVTDIDGNILGIPNGNMVNFEPAGVGTCFVYGLSYTGNLQIGLGDNLVAEDLMISDDCFDLSSNWVIVNRVENNCDYVDGGSVALEKGGTEATIVVDGESDVLAFTSTIDPEAGGFSFTFVVTDSEGNILGIPPGNEVDFDPAGIGTCYVYGLSYTGNLNIMENDNLLEVDLEISDDCFELSDNRVIVNRVEDNCDYVQSGNVMLANGGTETTILIDGETDVLTFATDRDPMAGGFSFTYVVTDEEGIILGIPGANQVDFEPAGFGTCLVYGLAYTGTLQIEIGDDLFEDRALLSDACFDLSDNWVIVNRVPDNCDFLVSATISLPDGNTQTTIVIDENPDVLTFTSNANPATGGFLFTYVVTDVNGNILAIPTGNNVDFNGAGVGTCYVYGLSYTGTLNILPGSNLLGDLLPLTDECFLLSTNRITVKRVAPQNTVGQIFVSSNTQPSIGTYDLLEDGSILAGSFPSAANDADGIYYDATNDVLYQLNRTNNVVDLYADVSTAPMLIASSSSDFSNGREIAVAGDKLVVAQDANDANGQQNRLIVYTITPTTITLDKAFDVNINLWGIHAAGSTLYAVVDNSGDLAVFENFFAQAAGALVPDQVVTIEGLVRTHGITYDDVNDLMLLTDVGDAADDRDGAIVAIRNFTVVSADDLISAAEQARVSGGSSQLGNPVDIALDRERGRVYVAERLRDGGKVLGFKVPVLTGGIAPAYSQVFPGASAIFFSGGVEDPGEALVDQSAVEVSARSQEQLITEIPSELMVKNVYPVPARSQLNVTFSSTRDQDVVLGIFDGTGQLILQRNLSLITGDNLTTIEVTDWPVGMYFIRIPGLDVTSKFVKAGKQ